MAEKKMVYCSLISNSQLIMKVCSSAQPPSPPPPQSHATVRVGVHGTYHFISLPPDKIVSKCACVRACLCAVVALVPLDKIVSECACVRACTCGAVALVSLDRIVNECTCVRACTCGVAALVPLDRIVNECTCMHACVLLLLFLLLEFNLDFHHCTFTFFFYSSNLLP